MKRNLSLLFVVAAVGSAHADITGFSSPTGSGTFSATSASGFHIPAQGPFDGHWTITLSATNPILTFAIDNSFNSSSGGGALSFDQASISSQEMPPTALLASPLTCQGQACHIGFQSTLTLPAGTYDLRVVGSNPFNGSYSVNVTAVPEPATWFLLLFGLPVALSWRRLTMQ